MTASELVAHVMDLINKYPACAHKEVKLLTQHGRKECDEVAISATENIWLIEK